MRPARTLVPTAATTILLTACATPPAPGPMGFSITRVGSGKGADLGGLAGADAHGHKLASAAAAGGRSGRAYLSVPPAFASGTNPAVPAIHARDRIGNGAWSTARAR